MTSGIGIEDGVRGTGCGVRGAGYVTRSPLPVTRYPKNAFTLVEVMVATAILSLGAVLIYETLLVSVGAFDYYSDYLYLAPKMEEEIWQAQNNISRFGYAARIQPEGVFTKGNKIFSWNMSYELSDEAGDFELYKISFLLHREGGEKRVEFTRNAYAMYKKEE